jgi:peptidoglycan L-alanyl-D-glutamate endopeptidase CwlK
MVYGLPASDGEETMPKFSNHSKKQLDTCDERLQKLFKEVVKHWDCKVLDGRRSIKKQKELYEQGCSKIDGVKTKSKHNHKPSLAADVGPYPIDWDDMERFRAFGGFVLDVASQMGIPIRWGGDWDSDRTFKDQTFIDMPHFEIDV